MYRLAQLDIMLLQTEDLDGKAEAYGVHLAFASSAKGDWKGVLINPGKFKGTNMQLII